MRRDGSGIRPLLTPKTGGLPFVDLLSPQWSPDGSQITVAVRDDRPSPFSGLHRTHPGREDSVVERDDDGLARRSRREEGELEHCNGAYETRSSAANIPGTSNGRSRG